MVEVVGVVRVVRVGGVIGVEALGLKGWREVRWLVLYDYPSHMNITFNKTL